MMKGEKVLNMRRVAQLASASVPLGAEDTR